MSKVLYERAFGSLPRSTKANSRDHVKSISTTVEADTNPIHCMGSSQYAVYTSQSSKLIYETRQTTIPFPSHLNDYYCEEKKGSYRPKFLEANSYKASHIDKSIPRKEKDPRSFTLPCYINNVCFDNTLVDLEASFYNSIMKDKVEYKGKNVVGAFMNVPIFVGNFSVVTHFAAVENMDGYRDQDTGDVIVGEPLCKASCVEERRFDGLITINNGNDNVTYQMA
ncbi:hypothetical protein Tco_1115298 [Tanacetum coccineum]